MTSEQADKERADREAYDLTRPRYYECGICCRLHPVKWNGDCRDDANRFASDQLDARHGPLGWACVEMPTWDSDAF